MIGCFSWITLFIHAVRVVPLVAGTEQSRGLLSSRNRAAAAVAVGGATFDASTPLAGLIARGRVILGTTPSPPTAENEHGVQKIKTPRDHERGELGGLSCPMNTAGRFPPPLQAVFCPVRDPYLSRPPIQYEPAIPERMSQPLI